MVRANHNMNIALSPLNLSPNNYVKKEKMRQASEQEKDKSHKKGLAGEGLIKIIDGSSKMSRQGSMRGSRQSSRLGSAGKRKNNAEIKTSGRRGNDEEFTSRSGLMAGNGDADPLNTVTTLNFENLDAPK